MSLRDELDCYASGNWFMFPRAFLQAMKPREAVVLAYMINYVHQRLTVGNFHGEGWVELITRRIEKDLALSERSVKRAISTLRELGLIKVSKSGFPARRFVLILAGKLKDQVNPVGPKLAPPVGPKVARLESRHGTTPAPVPKGRDQQNPVGPVLVCIPYIRNKRNNCPSPSGSGRDEFWDAMGKQLLDGVAAVRKVPSSATPYKWGTAMRQLEARDGYDRDEIEKVLEWYVRTLARDGDIIANGNPNYIPVVWSGPAFRKKFGQLQDAMARDRAKRQPSQPKVRLRRDAIADNDTSYRDDPNYLGDD